MSLISKIFGDPNEKTVKSIMPVVAEINSLEEKYRAMADEELRNQTAKFKENFSGKSDREEKEVLEEILPEAFAAVREAARRTLGQRHFDVQLIGGVVLHSGQIAEMKTGEGKTLVATLPLYLNAISGRGAHLVTVNDYLSRLGAGWMAPVYHALGMTTGVIVHDVAFIYDPEFDDETQYDRRLRHFRKIERKDAYRCDILYGTNNEFGFDYLRDNMAPSLERMAQRELHYAIVDEIDSILIDEARTPLIISAPAEESTDRYFKFAELVARLKENEDYNVDEKMRAATLTEEGITQMEKWLGVENIYTSGGVKDAHHIEQALKARTLFKRDRDYVVKDGEIVIVDEFTGRLMFGRRYSEGLHQAIEAKEGVKVQRESETLATITFQNFFRMYEKLAGMTGTAMTEAEEFYKIYKLDTVAIPTNKPMVRKNLNDLIYRIEEGKYKAVIADIKRRHEAGQPLLIGTISIEKNELLASMMEKHGLKPQMLNAKNHEKEAKIIAEAGKIGAITLATNMAGRGVDIVLGGVEPPFRQQTTDDRREDDKNYESEILNSKQIQNSNDKNSKHDIETNVSMPRRDKTDVAAETPGGRLGNGVETNGRLSLRDNNDESEEHKKWREEHEKVVVLGGLHVIGTERHEARRIDNQLRGRAGRQGDPGSSQFYVSTEDDLMRIFGGDRMKSLMTTLRVPDDMPIENKLISKSIESAQMKVEGNNFDIRKHLVEYDDVINKHREAIYRRRRQILQIADNRKQIADEGRMTNNEGQMTDQGDGRIDENSQDKGKPTDLSKIILDMVENEIEQVAGFHTGAEHISEWNINEILQVASTIFPLDEKVKSELAGATASGDKLDIIKVRTRIIECLVLKAKNLYDEIKNKALSAGVNWAEVEKAVLIRSIDMLWVEHLEAMSSVRQGIGLRGYGQRDPLIEYKREAYLLFNELNNLIQKQVVYSIYKVGGLYQTAGVELVGTSLADRAREFKAPAKEMTSRQSAFADFKSGNGQAAGPAKTDNVQAKVKDASGRKVGRNDPCPCGAKKPDGTAIKFKHCHGK